MEGYLQKRFKTGIVKTLKRKWYVLKDGELRCYQSKDACEQNVEIYQECIPICSVQAVRAASESLGVEVVTQQKVIILVASSVEAQQKWIKAIYDTMKEDRPRSVSGPVKTTENSYSKSRLSTGPKVSISRILPVFTRKFSNENQGHGQSTFYVDSTQKQPERTEIGTQADLTPNSEGQVVDEEDDTGDTEKASQGCCSEPSRGSSPCLDREVSEDSMQAKLTQNSECEVVDEEEMRLTSDDTGDTEEESQDCSELDQGSSPCLDREGSEDSIQAKLTQKSECKVVDAEDEMRLTSDNTRNMEKTCESSDLGQGISSPCLDRESNSDLEFSGSHVASHQKEQSETAADTNVDDDGIKQLQLMLLNSSLLASEEEGDEDEQCHDEDNEDDGVDLEDPEGSFDGDDDNAQTDKSAFEQLQELLLKT